MFNHNNSATHYDWLLFHNMSLLSLNKVSLLRLFQFYFLPKHKIYFKQIRPVPSFYLCQCHTLLAISMVFTLWQWQAFHFAGVNRSSISDFEILELHLWYKYIHLLFLMISQTKKFDISIYWARLCDLCKRRCFEANVFYVLLNNFGSYAIWWTYKPISSISMQTKVQYS